MRAFTARLLNVTPGILCTAGSTAHSAQTGILLYVIVTQLRAN
jgi:hypothetical protein